MQTHELVDLCYAINKMAMDELRRKAPDYAPEGVVFVDLVKQCAEGDIPRPEQLLWAMLSKHTTAVRRFCLDDRLSSELLGNRIIDTINFTAILYVWALQSTEILITVADHFRRLDCVCHPNLDGLCDRCLVLAWYARYHERFLMDSTSEHG